MRVLHIGKYFLPHKGGIEQFLADLVPALQREGIEVGVLAHGRGERKAHRRPFLLVRAPTLGELLYTPISPTFPLELRRLLRDFRPDLIHAHLPNPAAFWLLLEGRKIPLILHWHADVIPSRLDRRLAFAYPLYRHLEEGLLKRASTIIATSPPYAERSIPLARHREKVEVVPLGLNPKRLRCSDWTLRWAERLWRPGALRLLHVGRLTYYKGYETMLEAMKGLEGVHLLLVGAGALEEDLRHRIETLNLNDRVDLLGEVGREQRNGLLQSCDLLLLPSLERTEAFGLVLLEAMACGKPVIASDIPGSGVGWVVRKGGGGLLIRPGDPASLKAAVLELEDPRRRSVLGKQGQSQLLKHFHIDLIAPRIAELYRKIACA